MKLIDTKMHRPDHSRKESCGLPSILRSCRCGAPDAYRRKRNVTYNPRSELTAAAMGTNQYGFVFDNIGNRETYTNNSETLTYLANSLNQYTNIADGVTNTPTYDFDGNMLTYNGWTYSWNGENRLSMASNASTVVSFKYDYMGRRFSKTTNSVTTAFIYDGWNLIRETSSVATNNYVWGLDLSGSMQGAGGIGGLLATVMDGATYFSAFDANGNVCQYVDTNGTIVAHREFDPFGGTIALTGSKKGDFNLWFSTHYLNAETGQYYCKKRYYSPDLGRWLNRDGIGESGGQNLYTFVLNASVNLIDPFGRVGSQFQTIGTHFKILVNPYFNKISRPPGTPANQHGAVEVESGYWINSNLPGISGWESGWRLKHGVDKCDNGCYRVYGDTSLYGTKWWDNGSYNSPSTGGSLSYQAHEQHHVGIWSTYWAKYIGYVQQFDPEDCVSQKRAVCKADWIQWLSSMYFAKANIENGRYDLQEYDDPGNVDAATLTFYVNWFNLMLSYQPTCQNDLDNFNVNVNIPPESLEGIPPVPPTPDPVGDIPIEITPL